MKLIDTVEMMNSKDFTERFRAEYFQLCNRIDGLSIMLNNYRKGTLKFTPKSSIKLLDGQMRSMIMYRTHLEERAKIEDVSLEEKAKIEDLSPEEKDKIEGTSLEEVIIKESSGKEN